MKEPNTTLTGFKYELRFSEIERVDTTRRIIDGGHDCRESEPAYVWRGSLEVYDRYRAKGMTHPFTTEVFFQDQVEDLTLEDIIFLNVCRKLYSIGFRDEESKKMTIDYLAQKLLTNLFFKSVNEENKFEIDVFDFRSKIKDASLLKARFISFQRLSVDPGIPGKIEDPEV